jgi:RNA polymerase sigma-70 factor (ECF subfamily)
MLGDRFEAVLHAAAAGDHEALGELWRATHPPLLRYLRVMCGDSADDVASETWLRAMPALHRFAGDESAFRGWLVVVARNHYRDLARRAARRPEDLSADMSEHLSAADPADTAEAVLERRSTAAALRLVATLPPDQAELVVLRVVVGLDVADVARIVGRSPGAVRVAVHRALRTLAGRLREGSAAPRTSPATTPVTLPATRALGRRDA